MPKRRYNKKAQANKKCKLDDLSSSPIPEVFGEATFRPPTTPFELPNLLLKILKYLPIQDWKHCRQVCSQWNEACSDSNCNNKFRLNILDKQRLRSLTNKSLWGYNPNPEIYRELRLPEDMRLTNVELLRMLDTYGKHVKALIVPNGWSVEGLRPILFNKCPNLEELQLMGHVLSDRVDQRILNEDDPETKLMNLRKFTLYVTNANQPFPPGHLQNLIPLDPTGANYFVKLFITDLLAICPNLESVQCPNKRDMRRDKAFCAHVATKYGVTNIDVEASFNKINQFIAQKLFSSGHVVNPKLTRLNLYLRLNSRGMEKLAAKQYPLEYMDLHIRNEDTNGLKSLLQSLAGTLKHLRLTTDHKLRIDYPCSFLHKLESIHLEDYAWDLIFLGDIPKLTKVTLHYFNSNNFVTGRHRVGLTPAKGAFTTSSVKTLLVENLLCAEQQARCVKKLGILFPNVRELKLDKVVDRDLQRIYDCLPKLESLDIVSIMVSNQGLSGFTDLDTEAILESGYELHKHKAYESTRRLPHIGQLKNLKSLALSGDLKFLSSPFRLGRDVYVLHGMWVLHGICDLKELRSLTIHNVPLASIELKQIFKKLNLARLELVNCKVDEAALTWAKKKLKTKPMEFIVTNATNEVLTHHWWTQTPT